MSETPSSWDDLTGHERVRAVVETADSPMSVVDITDRADVSRTTADDELAMLAERNDLVETLVDGKRGYETNYVSVVFDEMQSLVEDHTEEELTTRLAELEAEREQLQTEFDADSLDEFRTQTAEDETLSVEELRERRHVAASWDTLDAELTLVRHALRLYRDVVDIGQKPSRSTVY